MSLLEEWLPSIVKAILELDALVMVEAYELRKELNQEKRVSLLSKRLMSNLAENDKQQTKGAQSPPDLVKFCTYDEFSDLFRMIKQRSCNFDENGMPKPNQAHLFMKFHVWMDSRF
jgi:hypothetical protein